MIYQTLPKTQSTRGIEYFDSFNSFGSKQKLQQALKSWSNFSLVLFGKGREIHGQIQIYVTFSTNQGQGKAMIGLGSNKNESNS